MLRNPGVNTSEGLILQLIVFLVFFDFQISVLQLFFYLFEHLYLLEEDLERIRTVERAEKHVYVH